MSLKSPEITLYDDYRKFITDSLIFRKKVGKPCSFRWIAKQSGFKSPNMIHLVVHGKRHLSAPTALRVAQALGLNKSQTNYFIKLVGFTKSETYTERDLFAAEMVREKNKGPISSLRKDQFEYYATWYNIVVREYLTLPRTSQEVSVMARQMRPPLKEFEIVEALKTLERLGMIQKNSDQRYIVTDQTIGNGNKVTTTGLVRFHRQMMEFASQSLDKIPSPERDITGLTAGLSKENFLRVREMIKDLRGQILALSEKDSNKDIVYQLNLQLFPVTKKAEKPNE